MDEPIREELHNLKNALNEAFDPKFDPRDFAKCFDGADDNPDCPVCDAIVMMKELASKSILASTFPTVELMETVEKQLIGTKYRVIERETLPEVILELETNEGLMFQITFAQTNAYEGD